MSKLAVDAASLTPREKTVLHLIVWGYTYKEIATHLGLSVKTVDAHKSNGMRKLGATGRAQLVRTAVSLGWLLENEAPALG